MTDLTDRPVNSRVPPKRLIVEMMAIGILLAISTDFVFFILDQRRALSALEVFRQVTLAMPRSEVDVILAKYQIACVKPDSGRNDPVLCEFLDPWRDYTLTFDQPDGRVIAIRYYFRSRPGVLERLLFRSRF
jgi:hypothetical protein